MAFKHKEKPLQAYIPTASMADIAFLLIIFFMVTTQFQLDRTNVALPKSDLRQELPKGAAFVVIYEEAGIYTYKFSDGEQVSHPVMDLSALDLEVNVVASRDTSRPFAIKCPNDIPYKYVDEVIELIRRAGAEEIVMLTGQRTVDDI